MFEDLNLDQGQSDPSEILQKLIVKDDDIDLKTKLTLKANKVLCHIHHLNSVYEIKDNDPLKKLEEILNFRYKSYMASLDGWRSEQIKDSIRQWNLNMQLGQTTSEGLIPKK